MKVEYWNEIDVNPDGTFGEPVEPKRGSIEVDPQMKTSYAPQLPTRSAYNNPFWMFVSTGRLKDGSIHGITIYFDSEEQMKQFFREKVATL